MPNNLLVALVIGGLIILVLLNETLRKLSVLLLALALAFALGWYWPKVHGADVHLTGAGATSASCFE